MDTQNLPDQIIPIFMSFDNTSNTMKLAKCQNTFNKTQFNNLYMGSVEEIRHAILKHSKSGIKG